MKLPNMCHNNKILVSVLVLSLLSQVLVEPQGKLNPRINNGYPCSTNVAPYFVIVHTAGDVGKACGGSLITFSWVLTAAHCIVPHPDGGDVLSAFDMSPELKQVRNIKELHPHPNYNHEQFEEETLRGDIGLVLVNEPFHETAATRVATLPAPGFTKLCNQVLATGIGIIHEKEVESFWDAPLEQRALKCANLSLIDINFCIKNYSDIVRHPDNTGKICTYGTGKEGPCSGDSGGPLICDNAVIGIASAAGNCSVRTRPTIYTMVESYLDFLHHLIKFSMISIKHGRTNGSSVGGQKPSDKSPANTNNKHVHTNVTSVPGKKASDKSPANIMGRVPNWKLAFFPPILIVLYR